MSDKASSWVPVIVAAVITAAATIVAAFIGLLNLPNDNGAAAVAQPTATTPTPTHTPAVTVTPTSTPSLLLPYDSFDDGCIDIDTWGMFTDSALDDLFMPTPMGPCWDVAPEGFSESDGQLRLDHTNPTPDQIRSFLLAARPDRAFTRVEVPLTVESVSGQWGGVGLFARLNDEARTWAHFVLQFGGSASVEQGFVYYEAGDQRLEGDPQFSLPATVTLALQWDGQAVSFYADGDPVLQPAPFSGYSDVFGIYWIAGPESSVKFSVDEFRALSG